MVTYSDCPDAWRISDLGSIVYINPKEKLHDELEIGFMPMAGMPTDYLGKCSFSKCHWHEKKKGFTQFRDGDVLFAKITPCFENGKSTVVRNFPSGWGAGSTEYYVLRPVISELDPRYVHALLSTKEFLVNGAVNMSGSVGHKRVPKDFVSQYTIPLPPAAEQKVIADKLDELLAQVDILKARLDAIPAILKRFRQSVLAAAVSGRLTEDWRDDVSCDDQGYPITWSYQRLSDVGTLARGKSKHRPRNDPRLFGDKYPFIQTGEVANSRGEVKSASKFYSEFGLAQSQLFPRGTLCITIAANIADTAILGIDACFPDSVVGFTPDRTRSHEKFVKFLIENNKTNLEEFAPATAQKNINLKVLNDLKLPMPGPEEQIEIVHRVDQLFAYADQIGQQVNKAQARVDKLTQSILAKAFRGELTEQWRKDNPELISGENSAEALLARIKAEREAAKPKKKTRSRRAKS
ncbi:restriction endonuclease subunit S [Spongiibacter nanhainus]|uniref:Restriction endonuclease subunit S n=1 Tax=Spongiibacter nanhainus TaxID=2794344 RepID=A0A7T4R3L9_9GAMM|nr:restriction endonuclease subunit S [Spongiibacter nanhainus]QQD19680.1 restriction endonuclease subunit S [Spongiibacter nanhainus]